MRLPLLLVAGTLLGLSLAPPAAAYSCSSPVTNVFVCDVNDDGVPDVYTVVQPGVGTVILVAYKDPFITSVGAGYYTFPLGFQTGGVGVGCVDFDQNLDCEYGSVSFGSSSVGYLDVQKFGSRVQVCRYGGVWGWGCTPLL